MKSHWFVHVDSPVAWNTNDPIGWCLTHRHREVLRPARPQLDLAVMGDDSSVVSVVIRSCRLNLVTLEPGSLTARHWGQDTRTDLMPFLKHAVGGRQDSLRIEFHDDQTGVITGCGIQDLRQGLDLPEDWPLAAFNRKFQLRRVEEHDDDGQVPLAGERLVQPIPSQTPWTWADLKAFWTSNRPLHCPDCDRPAILAHRGCAHVDAFRWRPRHVYVCRFCRTRHVRDPQRAAWLTPTRGPLKKPPVNRQGDR